MSQVFKEDGTVVPVTLLEVGPCVVAQVKTKEKEGYQALQLGFGKKKKITKPLREHLKGLEWTPRYLCEFRTDVSLENLPQRGEVLHLQDVFKVGDKVVVWGISKGKGFAGVVKRWGFADGPKTHGQTDKLRAPGSIGAQGVGRVVKGKKMPGRMGGARITVKGLEVIEVEEKNNVMKVKGAVPGNRGGLVVIKKE